MTFDWYVIYSKVTGKKRPGGLMHSAKAFAKIRELLRGEATRAEIAAYDAAILSRDIEEATRLYGLWQARSVWAVVNLREYEIIKGTRQK